MKKTNLIILATLLFFSCDKDDKCTITTNSLAGNYRITAVTYKSSATATEQDYFALVFPDICERDDIYTLSQNGTYQLKDAGVVCVPSNDDAGTWSLSGNNIVFDGEVLSIESFDCKTLKVISKDVQISGDQYKINYSRI